MGYDVHLRAKTRDEEKHLRIYECQEKNKRHFLSRTFAMFQSRYFDDSEFDQVQLLLDIDLSVYRSYPLNADADTGELEYRLYQAETNNNKQEIELLEKEIAIKEQQWADNYELINEGWVSIEEMRRVTLLFIEKINQNPGFGKKIKVPEGWEYPWRTYFDPTNKTKKDSSLLDDLNAILSDLECIEKEDKYVFIFGQ